MFMSLNTKFEEKGFLLVGKLRMIVEGSFYTAAEGLSFSKHATYQWLQELFRVTVQTHQLALECVCREREKGGCCSRILSLCCLPGPFLNSPFPVTLLDQSTLSKSTLLSSIPTHLPCWEMQLPSPHTSQPGGSILSLACSKTITEI